MPPNTLSNRAPYYKKYKLKPYTRGINGLIKRSFTLLMNCYNRITPKVCMLMTLAVLIVPARCLSQNSGSVEGKIVDSKTGDPLAGANIRLKNTTMGIAAKRDGRFKFNQIPSGEQTLVVSFIGYQTQQVPIDIEPGANVTRHIALKSTTLDQEGIVVTGLRGAYAKSLRMEKDAINIKSVISADDIGDLPDDNVSEALQRVSGIAISRENGEGKFVSIRGMNENLNTITVDGVPLPSAQRDVRGVGLDAVSSSVLGSIEVIKAPTADMEASGLGGVVRLNTPSAFDFNRRVMRGSVGGTYSRLSNKYTPEIGAMVGDQWGSGDKLGVLFSVNYDQRSAYNNVIDVRSMTDVINTETGEEMIFGGNWKTRAVEEDRKRFSSVLNLDYNVSPTLNISLRSTYSRFFIDRLRSQIAHRFDDALKMQSEEPSRVISVTGKQAQVNDIRLNNNTQSRQITNEIISIKPQADGSFGNFDWNFRLAYSQAQLDRDVFRMAIAQSVSRGSVDWSENMYEPNLDLNGERNFQDPASYTDVNLVDITNDTRSKDSRAATGVDLKYNINSGNNTFVKGGYNYASRQKDKTPAKEQYTGGPEDVSLADFTGKTFGFGGLPEWKASDPEEAKNYFYANRDAFTAREDNSFYQLILEDYSGTENVQSGYILGNFSPGSFSLNAGIRYEHTQYSGKANQLNIEQAVPGDLPDATPVEDSESYGNILPSFNIRYNATENLSLRVSASRSIMRPSFGQLSAKKSIDTENQTVSAGNPSLDPYISNNLDLMVLYYTGALGKVNVGLFYKKINSFIFNTTSTLENGPFEGFRRSRPENGEDAKLYGLELGWQQQLFILPSPFDGMGFGTNLTLINSEQRVTSRPDEKFNLVGQSDQIFNLYLSYQKYGITARAAYNYRSDYLNSVANETPRDIIVKSRRQLDASISYFFRNKWTLFAEAVNITNEPRRVVRRGTDFQLPHRKSVTQLRANIGVRLSL